MSINLINLFFDFFVNLDKNILSLITAYGSLVYFLLFLVIFLETGLVIAPFLPGDSLIFAVGAIAGMGALNIFILFFVLFSAAILGDTVNYYIGRYFGLKLFNHRWIKREYFHKTQEFYENHGGKTIIIARFIPIIRTFAPFVAGVGKMNYPKFLFYNILGGILWVCLFLFGGYLFGNIPLIKENFTIVILLIVFLSLIPVIIHLFKRKKQKN